MTHEDALKIAVRALLDVAARHGKIRTLRQAQLAAQSALNDLDAILPGSTGRD